VGTKVLDPLMACVKVADCCDLFSVGTQTCVKTLLTILRVDHFFCFGEDD
jgi:hypothetical protein